MKNFFLIFIIVLMSFPLQAQKSSDPIAILRNDWTSQIVFSEVIAKIYQSLGYKTKFKKTNTKQQWGYLKFKRGNVQVEVWEGTMKTDFEKFLKLGSLIDAGAHEAKTREDWWYPEYVEKLCPGLPSWEALKKCGEAFATSSTGKRGRYLGGPWEKPDAARIRALKIPFVIERVKQGDDLWVELGKAFKEKKPIILFNWTPNWIEAKYKGKFVEFPEWSPKCETDASWGVNPNNRYDCGNPKGGWLKKAASTDMPSKWPCAFEVLKKMSLSNSQIAQASLMVDFELLSYEAAATRWMKNNKTLWKSWIPKTCEK